MRRVVLAGVGMLSVAALVGLGATLAKPVADERVASVEHLMEGISKPHCSALGKLLKAGPSSERDWKHVKLHAALLNELSYMLLQDGRCPDATWAKAAQQLRSASAEVFKAASSQDTSTARAAFKKVTASCATCHKVHRK